MPFDPAIAARLNERNYSIVEVAVLMALVECGYDEFNALECFVEMGGATDVFRRVFDRLVDDHIVEPRRKAKVSLRPIRAAVKLRYQGRREARVLR